VILYLAPVPSDLALCLGALDEDEFPIVASKHKNHFVQFAAQGAFGMRMEAACDAYIEPPDVLADFAALSQIAVRSLREVYRVPYPGQLQYSAFGDNTQVRFPTLKIKRRARTDTARIHAHHPCRSSAPATS
jgi:hypothetical protein